MGHQTHVPCHPYVMSLTRNCPLHYIADKKNFKISDRWLVREEGLNWTPNDITQRFHFMSEFVSGQDLEGRIPQDRKTHREDIQKSS